MWSRQILVIGGLALVAGVALAAGPERPGRPEERGPRDGRAEIKEALGLTDAQVADLHKLRMDEARKRIQAQANVRIARLELRELLAAPTVDEKAVRAKAKELEQAQTAAEEARVEAMIALRRIVNAEQAEKLLRLREHRRHGRGPDDRPPREDRDSDPS